MQNQAVLCRMLEIQCLLQGADYQTAGNVSVCYACNYTPVIDVYDGTVVTHIPVFQEHVHEIRAPFPVREPYWDWDRE